MAHQARPKTPRHPKDTIRSLTIPQVQALLRAAKRRSRRDYALFLIAYRHGLRASELGNLKGGDVDWEARRIAIKRVKNSEGGAQVLRDDEALALRGYLKERRREYARRAKLHPLDPVPPLDPDAPLFPSRQRRVELGISRFMVHHLMKRYGREAGLPEEKLYPHVLKHSLATHLAARGHDPYFIRDLLGHRNMTNTLLYVSKIRHDAEARGLKIGLDIA